ncbi:retrovirus-related pol polyprotein from transposon TNT 1-94 [Tanacetum coccineum]
MTGNRKLFSTYKAYNGGNVIFGSNLRGNIIGKGTISNDFLKIDNVEHVDNLRFNLLSVGKICDNKCRVTCSEHDSEITKDDKVIGRGIRKKGLYVMKLRNKPKHKICLATIDENSTSCHRRLGHANMHLIQSLASKELVRNLPKLKFDQHFCDACKIGKQAHASHKAKNIVSTTRCLELLHMDLFGPSAVQSYGGNLYTIVIVDDYSRKPTLDYFRVFRSKCFILNTKDYLTKFDTKSYEGVFLGYSQNSKAYIILNKHTIKIEESLNVTFNETPPPSKTSPLADDDLDEVEAIKSEEWDASNPEFCALFILEDGASVARIWGVKGCTIIAIIYDLGVTEGEVGIVDSQVGCRIPGLEHYKPQPCARTLTGTCPSDMTAYTLSALSPLGVSPSYPSYHTKYCYMPLKRS